ncbi:phage tail length tape measure family protein [Azotobacter chroococcum]|uniref:Phage tail length tape measure family protein n=1 Tax=Azotobacter chroococcum TaxID=353 RepID=A0AAP9YJ18_9GAMM|nr:phage tail length tape measure family protein [Azotobacter chroococcum]QQE90274.1 phage tail length tape measure family protein [Azotobacter chroococcum]
MAEKIELSISANVDAAMKEVAGFRREYAELVRQVEKPLRQVNSFRELESSLEQTGRKMREARDRVRELGNVLASVEQPTKEMAAGYKLAVAELKALERQELTQIGQLSRMRTELQGAGLDMRNLAAEQSRLAGEFSTRLDAGRADATLNSARGSLGVGAIEQTQRQLVDLRQQYQLVTRDSTLSAKQRAEAEANYRSNVASTLAQLRELRAGLNENGQAMQRAGLSAGQYQQAMQQLPMQLTDVVTSLASGMPLWMVLIQQGGQIRDSFGGIGNAASAIVSSINPMTAAIGGAVVVGGTLLAAFVQGRREASAYEQALIMSGNAAGTSADQLAAMAQRMDAANGTQRQAAAALAEIAGTGKFAADQIEAIGTAAVAMEESTGKAVSDTVAEFASLAEEPSKAVVELNKRYNFLTGAVYAQIAALEKQGDTEGAARLAVEAYGEAMNARAEQITERLGYLESAWRAVGKGAAEAWDAMLDIGRAATLEEKLADAYQQLQRLQNLGPARDANDDYRAQELESTISYLQGQIQARETRALEQRQQGTVNEAGLAAAQKLDSALASTAGNAEKLKARLKEIDDQAAAAARAGMAYSEQKLKQLKEAAAKEFTTEADQYQDDLRRQIALHGEIGEVAKLRYAIERGELGELTEIQKQSLLVEAKALDAKNATAEAAKQQIQEAEQLARSQESYVAGLEKQAFTLGLTAAQVRAYELAEKSLTGALNERAKAALAVLDAHEKQQQADQNAATNSGLQADYLRATGQPAEAAMLEIETRFAQMRKQFAKDSNAAGLALIDQLVPVEQVRARLDSLQTEIDTAFSATDRAESRISTEVDAGLITETAARAKILELRRQEADVLERQLPALREIAAQGGVAGEQALNQISEIENKIILARTAASDFELALKNGLTGGIQEALAGLADGTMSLRDAVTSLVSSVADALAQLAAQQVAEQVAGGLMRLFSGGDQGESLTVGAAAVSGSAASLAVAGGSLITGAAAIEAAAVSLAAASAAAGASGSGGGGMFSSLSSWFGFASGGHVTGPGTTTSDSIPAMLSNWEYVTRASVVQQPGALAFLDSFNRNGMAALDDYARRVHHATGGLAGVPAPALPRPSLPSLPSGAGVAAPGQAQQPINLRIVNSFDAGEAVSSGLNSAVGERALLNVVSANRQKIKALLS